MITAERGEGMLTRHGLEEYVADCVILLDQRVNEQISTRRMRIVKYRGSVHGTNEYPFLIGKDGLCVMPVTTLGLDHPASQQRISSGIPALDRMLGGKGFYRGSSILVSGTAGTGKTSIAAAFVDAACRRGERAFYFAFEESRDQIVRNMRSIGLDLEPWAAAGLLTFHAARPTLYGLEMHLLSAHEQIASSRPQVVVFDPITNLMAVGTEGETKSMLTRLIDFLKSSQVTAVFTSLTGGGGAEAQTDVGVSSLMDAWLLLRNLETGGERNRVLHLLKSRGMAHSNQVREFILSNNGIDLVPVYSGPSTVLTGSARLTQDAREKAEARVRQQAIASRQREIERARHATEAQIIALRAELEGKVEELQQQIDQEKLADADLIRDREDQTARRTSQGNGRPGRKLPA